MAQPQLRIFHGPEPTPPVAPPESPRMNVSLREVLPALADAFATGRTWISDFEDEQISMSSDLYELLLAYDHFRSA